MRTPIWLTIFLAYALPSNQSLHPIFECKIGFFFFFFQFKKGSLMKYFYLSYYLLYMKKGSFTQIIFYIQIDTRMTGDYSPTCAKFLPFFNSQNHYTYSYLSTYLISQCLPGHQMKNYNPTKLHFPIQFLVTAFLFSP